MCAEKKHSVALNWCTSLAVCELEELDTFAVRVGHFTKMGWRSRCARAGRCRLHRLCGVKMNFISRARPLVGQQARRRWYGQSLSTRSTSALERSCCQLSCARTRALPFHSRTCTAVDDNAVDYCFREGNCRRHTTMESPPMYGLFTHLLTSTDTHANLQQATKRSSKRCYESTCER